MKKNIPKHIKLLEWAKSNSKKGFTLKQLKKELNLNNIEFSVLLKNITHQDLFFNGFEFDENNLNEGFEDPQSQYSKQNTHVSWDQTSGGSKMIIINNSIKYFLSMGGHSILQEYYDLKESRENAENAQKSAKIAILLSFCALAISILVGVISIYYSIHYGESVQLIKLAEGISYEIINQTIQIKS